MRTAMLIGASSGAMALLLAGSPAAAQTNLSTPPGANPAPSAQSPDPQTAPAAPPASDTPTAPTAVPPQDGASGTEGGEIVVTGFRRSLAEGLELKREAIGVRDSIVAEDIGKFPEANVADSLQRIPGVILSRDGASNEGQRISIRGLGSEFTVTTINMAPVRTTSSLDAGGSSRNFNYDVFPSELFGRVDVYKTPLANLEEGGIGGNVDLQTPRPFDSKGRVIRYTAQGNYNTQSKRWGPRGSLLLSDTVGNFGALVGVAYSRTVNERSGFQSTGGYNSSVIGSGGYRTPPGQTRPLVGPFEFQLDLDNPRANFGGLTREQVANGLLPRFYRVFASDNERERLGLVGSLQYKTDRLDISLDGIYSHLKDIGDEFTWGVAVRNSRTVPGSTDPAGRGTNSGIIPLDVKLDQYNNLYGTFGNTSVLTESLYRTSETKFRYGILRASYDVTDAVKLSVQGNLSDSRAYKEGNRILSNMYGVTTTFDPTVNVTYPTITTPGLDPTDPRNYSVPTLGFGRDEEDDKQRNVRAVVDWNMVDDGDRLFALKLGGSYVSTVKEIRRRDGSTIATNRVLPGGGTFRTIDVFANMDPFVQFGSLRNGGNAGFPSQFATFPRSFVEGTLDAGGANAAAPVQLNGAFRAEEIVSTGFFEVNFKLPLLGSELRGNAGVRYSDTRTVVDNYVTNGRGGFVPANRRGGYDNWLPSASLAFDATRNLTLRASAGQTITRNALSSIAGSTVIGNPFNADVTVGNPDLRPQLATQYDAVAEWYFAPGALLSAGVFKKDITDRPFSFQDFVSFGSLGLSSNVFNALSLGFPSGIIPDDFQIRRTRIINQGELKLKGLEVGYQQNFTFLPKPFDGLGVTSSFTLIDQEGGDFIASTGTRRSISFVPDYSYSITGFYEKGPVSIRGSYNYRAKTGTSFVNVGNDQIAYVAPQGFLDGTVSYRVNDYIELRVDALNITNENVYLYYENPDQPDGNGLSRRDNSFFNGTTISFGIRGKF
ncbi:TonB-dependent receptor [Sphingomonas carotinifaciens]|uniref:TonB-dependent receptor n=2 Tax=Sphingomonas carotinifaciens TaxID=1166323 RepID=A0A1G7GFJ9_9SPHN|nr:TonB-dependent receptor [Sphingomonas carotinifaciens]MBB4086499.1 TonB-dependent receptor [Sphingomonas carotinifaciens]SDE86896.1 TonB-dependent receptor [Sphingomonas carotinifaciens]